MSQIFWHDRPRGGGGSYPLISVDCTPYTLDLRHQWTTSHSSTAHRTNALFTVKVYYVRDDGVPEPHASVVGYGEVGMPPKNPTAGYYAEYSDVEAFARRIVELLNVPNAIVFPIQGAHHLVASAIMAIESITQERASKCGLEVECMERFGKSGLQMALLDVLGQLWGVPVWCVAEAWTRLRIRNVSHDAPNITDQIDGIEASAKALASKSMTPATSPTHHAGYLTVSMNTPHEMAVNTLEALVATPFIKVKLDGDTALSWERLTAMAAAILDAAGEVITVQYATGPSEGRISGYKAALASKKFKAESVTVVIDANAAWSPEGSADFINILKTATESTPEGRFLRCAIKLLEQPFPTSLVQSCADALETHPTGGWVESSEVLSQWAALKHLFEEVGVLVFADESATVLKDLPTLCPFIHGVNIKLEKCGGILAAFHICHAVLDTTIEDEDRQTTVSQPPTILDLGRLQFAWIGTMVSSRLGCNGAAQLLYLTGQGDVDGSLLVTEKCQVHTGGFGWPSISECGADVALHGKILVSQKAGLGCLAK